ncbi:uncharacterized protein DUF3231 [Bacillus thuringiensis]|uniref:Uncharacterized protein DUF3231 n=2 Tax=Bacillus thuringiensis TaxID=1428 RepID=A0A4R4AW43_BACTU|nr:uncharacterized protein DUF3231 [Bacillus thuringiensis]TCW44605.1 uncharacterized protein DUF3231 [Bacillus thuringiensis]
MYGKQNVIRKSIIHSLLLILKSIFMMLFLKGRYLRMGILSGNPQNEPLHYGEVFDIWSALLTAQGAIAGYQVYINHTGDEDLKKFLDNLIENDMNSEVEELKALLKVNGVALPPAPPERPIASIEDIPPGARINDAEIAAAVSASLAAGLVTCSQVMGKCLREDVGMLFGQFHMKKAQAGVALLRLSKKKGWVVLPPLHVKNSDQA